MPKKIGNVRVRRNSISLPPNMAAAGWDIDKERIAEFAAAFGIKFDISFRWASGKYRWGTHYTKRNSDGTFRHHIVLNQNRAMESAARTLLHELCHAIQTERFEKPSDFHKEYTRYNHTGRHYQDENPFEIEAVNFAEDNLAKWGDVIY